MALGQYVTKMKNYLPNEESFVMASSQVVIMNDEGKFLLTQRDDDNKWDFPGGGCEETDDFKTTAMKEMQEELNLKVLEEDLEFIGVMSNSDITTMKYPNSNVTKYYTTVFGVANYSGEINFNDGETKSYKFVTLEEATGYDLEKSTRYIVEQLMGNNIPFIN